MIRSLSLSRNDKGLYDFGLEVATRSGLLAAYRAENTPEAASALDNIEELLNSMQEFKERCDAEIRNGERQPEEEATVEEWLQGMMLMSDMDKDDPESSNKVTLMTVHSAKGLEYKYVYIVGLEENLFPSQRAAESPDGIEEERRLFYVALTRAKVAATISYAEMRFRWGNMEFSRPSCFLREIDPRYVETEVDLGEERMPRPGADGASAIDELRRRFDYRFQQKQQTSRFGGNTPSNGFGGSRRRGIRRRFGLLRPRRELRRRFRVRPRNYGGGNYGDPARAAAVSEPLRTANRARPGVSRVLPSPNLRGRRSARRLRTRPWCSPCAPRPKGCGASAYVRRAGAAASLRVNTRSDSGSSIRCSVSGLWNASRPSPRIIN